jgi:hypothetical protein
VVRQAIAVLYPKIGFPDLPSAATLDDWRRAPAPILSAGSIRDPAGIDNDIEGHLDVIFAIAERHGVGVDIHLHDPGDLGCFELRQIAARAEALGLVGRVAVSHVFALGEVDEAEFGRTAEALARAPRRRSPKRSRRIRHGHW